MINETIRQYAGILSAKEIGGKVGISENAVYKRAQNMGLSLQRYAQNHPRAIAPDEQVRAAQILYDHGGFSVTKIRFLVVVLSEVHQDTVQGRVERRYR